MYGGFFYGKKGGNVMERNNGYFGQFGGAFVPEELKNVLKDVEEAFYKYIEDEEFLNELAYYQRQYIGRENPLYLAKDYLSN